MRPLLLPLSCLAVSAVLVGSPARAADDCPPGSVSRSQDGYTWCEPTVCENDGQCKPNEVCRRVPLCMQIGTLTADAAVLEDAGKRLVVTQRCAPDKTCPQTTVCSDMTRCLPTTDADRMGLLTSSSAAPSNGVPTASDKKSCGCHAVGSSTGPTNLLAAAIALSMFWARRRRR